MSSPFAPDRPVQENLPWLFPISDGVVVCKDSGFLATFEFEGIDSNSSTLHEFTAVLSRLDNALKYLSDKNITLWWTVNRRVTKEYPESHVWSNEISRKVDDVHRQGFMEQSNYINRHYISVVMHPSVGTDRFLTRTSEFMREGDNPVSALVKASKSMFSVEGSFAYSSEQLGNALSTYENILDTFSASLGAIGARRLLKEDFWGFLASCASPFWNGQPAKIVNNDRMEWFMDSLLGNYDLHVGQDVMCMTGGPKEKYVAAVSVKDWPNSTEAGELDLLLSMPCEMTVSHVFRFAGPSETKKQIESTKRFNQLLRHSLKSWIIGAFKQNMSDTSSNPARDAAIEECQFAEGEVTNGNLVFGWQTSSIIVFGDSEKEANELISGVFRAFAGLGYPGVVRETMHLLSAWATTMPGEWRESRRWALLSQENMEDVAPVRTIQRGQIQNKYLTEQTGRYFPALTVLKTDYATPFYFNFHVGALGHTLVLGPSRSGKSVFMNFLLSQWQKYSPCRAIIFDKDYSCKISTLLQGGMHIDLSENADEIRINPLSLVDDKQHWPFLCRWIEGLVCSKGYQTTADDEKAIREAVEDVASDPTQEHKRLMSIYSLLPERLKIQLEPWVADGALGHYFDNEEDTFSLADFSCIEMGFILREKRVARAFMDYAFYRIQCMMEQNRRGDVIPTFIYLEECWFLLEDEFFADRIRDWLKTMAKMTCHVVMATQSLEDIAEAESKVFSSMRDNIMTYIYLPNMKARTDSLRRLYQREFELTPEQINVIAEATPQSQYFIVTQGTARLTMCPFTKYQLAIFRSDAKAQGVFNRHYSSGREDWKTRYIEEMCDA